MLVLRHKPAAASIAADMKRRHPGRGALLLAGCCTLARVGRAFVVPLPHSLVNRKQTFTWSFLEQQGRRQGSHDVALSMLTWSAEERVELLRGLADWQDRDEDIGAAGIKILTESSPTAVLTRYYESLAAGDEQQVVLVAPSCAIGSTNTVMVERALSSACASRVYHPEAAQGNRWAPHLALWHEEAPADTFSPSSVLSEQTASLSQSAVMEEVFLWLQRTMLGMVDDEEEVFVDLGRKLLTVHKYVVANATTDADLSRTFWAEATALTNHGLAAAETMALQEGAVPGTGVGGSGDPREDSVLLALPGFRFKDRATFKDFVEDRLAGPLRTLSPIGVGGVELFADIYAGEDLKFPVIILSPYLQTFEAPDGGYKFVNGRGEEQDADAYIRQSELKLAEQAAERLEQQEENPLFPPPFPPVDEESD